MEKVYKIMECPKAGDRLIRIPEDILSTPYLKILEENTSYMLVYVSDVGPAKGNDFEVRLEPIACTLDRSFRQEVLGIIDPTKPFTKWYSILKRYWYKVGNQKTLVYRRKGGEC